VLIVTEPDADGVHCHQTEAPPVLPAWFGSPDSFVAPTLEPVVEPDAPDSVIALVKLLLPPDVRRRRDWLAA